MVTSDDKATLAPTHDLALGFLGVAIGLVRGNPSLNITEGIGPEAQRDRNATHCIKRKTPSFAFRDMY